MATIKDIAKNTGISISTISRVVNGTANVREEVKEKVLKEIERLDYKPNTQAQNLALKKNNLIGVILPNITNPYFAEVLDKIEEILFSNNYEIVFMKTNDDNNREKKCIDKLIRRNPEGIIIAPTNENEKYIAKLKNSKIPTVMITKIVEDFDSVGISHEIGGELIAKHLIDAGHEKIGFISDTRLHEKFDGFYKELKKNNINFHTETDFFDIGTDERLSLSEKVEFALKRKFENKKFEYTAIYAANDAIAFECINFFKKNKYKIPEDIAICGFDGTDFSRTFDITTISQPIGEIVNIATDMLLKNIRNNFNGEKKEHIEIVPRLVSRGSTIKINRK